MFDPFNDFAENGYLRNVRKDKDATIIKHVEHNLFRAKLNEALSFISSKKRVQYKDFLQIHRILFASYYRWAGQDRSITMPNQAVVKGDVIFCHPLDSKRAIDTGLLLGQNKPQMQNRFGEVMGLFAFGHPFLDGNGRAILLMHMELSYRAGFSISWADTAKSDYLDALGDEIKKPGRGILDSYLLQFKCPRIERQKWAQCILSMNGLNGLDSEDKIIGDLSDPSISDKYKKFEKLRGYVYQKNDIHIYDQDRFNLS